MPTRSSWVRSARGTALTLTPGSVVHVYTAGELALLVLAGLAIAIAGALGPATWAAASKTAEARQHDGLASFFQAAQGGPAMTRRDEVGVPS